MTTGMTATIHPLTQAKSDANMEKFMVRLAKAISVLLDARKNDEAFELAAMALEAMPNDYRGFLWQGIALRNKGELDAAEALLRHALEMKPKDPVIMANLGSLIFDLDPSGEALSLLREALEIDPSGMFTAQNYLNAVLSSGNYQEGWNLYGRRMRFPNIANQVCKYPGIKHWDGKSGGTVLLVGEEGIGERIMFASMIPDILKLGVTPAIELTSGFERFAPWFARAFPNIKVVGGGDKAMIDYQCVIGDLGGFFRRTAAEFPKHNGYMTWDRERAAEYKRRIGPGPVVGISYKSMGDVGPYKSLSLKQLAPLLNMPGATFVDLQYLGTDAERNEATPFLVHLDDLDPVSDPDSLAAVMGACDLIITVSSVTAHMAGAMGKPCWTFVPARMGRMWFWGTAGETSLWYPSMTLLRQQMRPLDWQPTIDEARNRLREFIHGYN